MWNSYMLRTLLALVLCGVNLGIYGQILDRPPLFEGCDDPLISIEQQVACSRAKLLEYVERKIEYPDSAALQGVEGVLVARFTIDTSGMVIMVELLKGLQKDCNEVALQVLRGLPRFSPALQGGQAQQASLTIPIRFQLDKLLHHPNEDLYHFHWAQQKQDSISRKELKMMLPQAPFVRDAKGLNYRIEKLELTYIKGRKLRTATSYDPQDWSPEMLDILQKARPKGILMFKAEIQDKYKKVVVIREFYII